MEMMTKVEQVEVKVVSNTGLVSLLGQRVLLMCANYFYEGVLEAVNDTTCMLSDPGIVYETGKWLEKGYADRQQLPGPHHYVERHAIESYTLAPDTVLT